MSSSSSVAVSIDVSELDRGTIGGIIGIEVVMS